MNLPEKDIITPCEDHSDGNDSMVPRSFSVVSPGSSRHRKITDTSQESDRVTPRQFVLQRHNSDLTPECQSCFTRFSSENDAVRLDSSVVDKWKHISVTLNENEKVYPIGESISGRSENSSVEKRTLSVCQSCKLEFGRIYELLSTSGGSFSISLSAKQELLSLKESIAARRCENKVSEDIKAFSKQCFLYNKCRTDCTDIGTEMYHPRRLELKDKDIIEDWIPRFAKAVGADKNLVRSLYSRCCFEFLCKHHTSMMNNELTAATASSRRCTICNLKGSKAKKQNITSFDWNTLRRNFSTACVIEDAVAVYTDNKIKPSDIERLCCGCRRVVTRQIDMSDRVPRDEKKARESDAFFEHGPTTRAVRKLIVEISHELWNKDNGKYIFFLKDARDRYDVLVCETGEMFHRLRHVESLKKYLLPSLAKTDIHLRVGAKKIGAYFCTPEAFDLLAAESKKPRAEDLDCSSTELKQLYMQVKVSWQARQEEIDSFKWKLRDFILTIPKKLWLHNMNLVASRNLLSRAKASAKISGRRTWDQEWPFNPEECPDDLHSRTNHEFSTVVSVYSMIEKMIMMRSYGQVRGPVTTAVTVAANEYGTTYLLSILNRLGVTASYQHLHRLRSRTIAMGQQSSPFEDLEATAFVSLGIDNINMRASHSLAVHGSTYFGYDGLAMQAVNSNLLFNFKEYCLRRPLQDNLPKFEKKGTLTRKLFMDEMPTVHDRDIIAYTQLVIGMAVVNRDVIASHDLSKQRSFRKVIMDVLKGFSGGKARIVYIHVKQCNPNQTYEIIQMLKKAADYYNPEGTRERVIIGVVGDQPIFKVLFELWFRSYVEKTWLCHWMVPIPGGFHMDKQCLLDLIKIYMAGSGFEQCLPFSGLSEKHQDAFHDLGHYRKNRRFMSQLMAAQLLRLEDVLRSRFPDVADSIRKSREEIEKEICALDAMSDKERLQFFSSRERAASISECLPTGSELAVSPTVSPHVLKIGRRIYEKVKAMSTYSVNMNFFGQTLLLNVLVPWSGYNILTRKAQTRIVDKFYIRFIGLLHGTTKLKYQELTLYYGVIRALMPQTAYDVLYNERHLVFNASATSTESNGALDDCIESAIIKDTRPRNMNNKNVVEKSTHWLGTRAGAKNVLRNELAPSRSSSGFHGDSDVVPGLPNHHRDREKK